MGCGQSSTKSESPVTIAQPSVDVSKLSAKLSSTGSLTKSSQNEPSLPAVFRRNDSSSSVKSSNSAVVAKNTPMSTPRYGKTAAIEEQQKISSHGRSKHPGMRNVFEADGGRTSHSAPTSASNSARKSPAKVSPLKPKSRGKDKPPQLSKDKCCIASGHLWTYVFVKLFVAFKR